MQKQNKTEIDKMDEALRLLWLDAGEQASLEHSRTELAVLLSAPVIKEMSMEKKEALLDKVFHTLSSVSLGEIITNKIQTEGITEEALAANAKLTSQRIEELKTDAVYPNSIPVLLLSSLLKSLRVRFDLADKAIRKTFGMVQKRVLLGPQLSTHAVYRRAGLQEHKDDEMKGVLRKASRNDLYENEEALSKYLNKLEELMTE
jgi:hypothetical protein